jgi:hypothetical protein
MRSWLTSYSYLGSWGELEEDWSLILFDQRGGRSCRGWGLESVIYGLMSSDAFIAVHVHYIFSMPPHVYDYLSTSYKHTTSEK